MRARPLWRNGPDSLTFLLHLMVFQMFLKEMGKDRDSEIGYLPKTSGGHLVSTEAGLPRWFSGKESACQGGRHRFNPWVGRILWRRKRIPTPVFLPGEIS